MKTDLLDESSSQVETDSLLDFNHSLANSHRALRARWRLAPPVAMLKPAAAGMWLGDGLALVPRQVPIGVAMARELVAAAAASLSPEDSWKTLSLLVSPVVQCLVGRPDWWAPLGLSSTDRSDQSVCGCCWLLALLAQLPKHGAMWGHLTAAA